MRALFLLLGLALGWTLGWWTGVTRAELTVYCAPTYSRVEHWQSSQDWLQEQLHSADLGRRLAEQLAGKPALQEVAHSLSPQVEEREAGVLRVVVMARSHVAAVELAQALWEVLEKASAEQTLVGRVTDAEQVDSLEKLNDEDRQLLKWLWEFTSKEQMGPTAAARAAGLRFESYQKAYEGWLQQSAEKRAASLRVACSRPLVVLLSGPDVRHDPVGWPWLVGGLGCGWVVGSRRRAKSKTDSEP